MDNLRNILLKYRQLNKITQESLANKIGVSRNCIANWETGRTKPTAEKYYIIANKLGVDVNLLLEPENDVKKAKEYKGIKLALYNQVGQLTEDQAKDILNYIEFVKSKNNDKK